MKWILYSLLLTSFIFLAGCQTMQPINTVNSVDIERFMGDWFVIASIPTFIEKNAHNALETYELNDDGTIAVTFTFNKGALDGPLKRYTPKAFIRDTSNAVWGMQFIWPFKAEYRIVYLDEDYATTIIGRTKRDYVWIMARTPAIGEKRYRTLLEFLETQGYDSSKVKRVPHRT